MIKMLVSDLDGTLLTLKKKVTSKNKKALLNMQKKGKKVVIATGRTIESARYAMDDFSYADYIISNNGATVYDIKNNKILFEESFSFANALKIFERYKEKIISINICSNSYYYQYAPLKAPSKNPSVIKVPSYDAVKKQNINVCHIDIDIKERKDVSAIAEEINNLFPDLEAFIMQDSFSENKWISVTKKNVSKSKSISKLQEILNISKAETLLFGDGLNDVKMLKQNGLGVAMGNALEEIKTIAVYETLSNEEDGVAYWLENNEEFLN